MFAGLLFAAVLTGGAMLLSLAAKDLYWKAPHLENALSDLSEYEARVTENDSGLEGRLPSGRNSPRFLRAAIR